jgi:hypothetical protein
VNKTRQRITTRQLVVENLETREYLSAAGWAPPISDLDVGPVTDISFSDLSVARDLILDEPFVRTPSAAANYAVQEMDDLWRDVDNTFIADGPSITVQFRTGPVGSLPTPKFESPDNTVMIFIMPQRQIDSNHRFPNVDLPSNFPVGESIIPRASDVKPEYRTLPATVRLGIPTQDIIASYGAALLSNNSATSKTEIIPVAAKSDPFNLTPTVPHTSAPEADLVDTANRKIEESRNQPQLNEYLESFDDDSKLEKKIDELDQLVSKLAKDRVSFSVAEKRSITDKSRETWRSKSSGSNPPSDIRNDDGLIAISTRYELLPSISIVTGDSDASATTWTQRVAMSQSVPPYKTEPRYQARNDVNTSSEEEAVEEPERSSQYWSIIPVALSMVAISWCRHRLHNRTHKNGTNSAKLHINDSQ